MMVEQAEQLIAMLAAAYPHTSIGGETVALYVVALGDATLEEGSAIVLHWITVERRWPSLAELRGLLAKSRGETAPTFDEAWREVRLAFGVAEHRRKPWSHPAIASTVDAFGLEAIGSSDEPEIMRAQFERYYNTAVKRYTPHSTMQLQRSLVDELKRSSIEGRPTPLLGKGRK